PSGYADATNASPVQGQALVTFSRYSQAIKNR
ncbi:MAG: hypothetical protein ACI9TP_002137, partial [Candidatus Azotimanducaceae bacterium]